jgi:hypothetical protein
MRAIRLASTAIVCLLVLSPTSKTTTQRHDFVSLRSQTGPAAYARQLVFEPNRGQTDMSFDFLAHTPAYSLVLSHGNAVMRLTKKGQPSAAVAMRLVGARASARGEGVNERKSKSNYFIGRSAQHWHTNIPNYERVRYTSVYPGIDMIYYGNQRQLEYDFVIHPGVDAGKILMDFRGTARVAVNPEGDVVMHTALGDVRWHKPVAYQESDGGRQSIACDYEPKGPNRIGFRLAAYDRAKPLVIDPELVFSTYLGGNNVANADFANGVAVDDSGNVYVTGQTGSTNFPTKDAYQSTVDFNAGTPGVTNAFITKFDCDGNLVFSTYLGGSGVPASFAGDFANAIALDHRGQIYVAGYAVSTDFPVKNAFQPEKAGSGDAFVSKFNREGNELIYSTYLGGTNDDIANGIAVDGDENAYVAGGTLSSDFPLKNANEPYFVLPGDGFVTEFDPNGNAVVFSTYFGNGGDEVQAIAVDEAGHAYVAGTTASKNFPVVNAFQAKHSADPDNAFVTKFEIGGRTLIYSTYLGGSGTPGLNGESGNAVAVDREGYAYVTGATVSKDFPTKNAFQSEYKGSADGSSNAFVTKFSTDGSSLVYSTYLGGSGTSTPNAGRFGDPRP